MVTLIVILLIMAALLMMVCGVSMILLDPIIAILVIYLLYKLIKKVFFRKK